MLWSNRFQKCQFLFSIALNCESNAESILTTLRTKTNEAREK